MVQLDYEPKRVGPGVLRRCLRGTLLAIFVMYFVLSLACFIAGRDPIASVVDPSDRTGQALRDGILYAGMSIMFYLFARVLRTRRSPER